MPDYDELVVVTSDEVAEKDPELVRSFLRALRKGQDWAATDQSGATKHLLDANEDLDETTVDQQVRLTADLFSPPDGPTLGLDPAEWAAMADWMRANGLLTAPLDVSQAVTERFLPEPPS